MSSDPKPEFICPITQEPMIDPVVCSDGNTYERKAIAQWLQTHKTSPLSNQPISDNLIENKSLRILINEWKATLPKEKQEKLEQAAQAALPKISPKTEQTKEQANSPIQIKTSMSEENGNGLLHIELTGPTQATAANKKKRAFILAIDVSGSMGDQVTLGGGDSSNETPFSRLDLAIHSVRAFLATLGDEDTLSLITFGTDTQVKLKPQKMTAGNKQSVSKLLDRLDAGGSTDMWGGIRQSLTMAREPEFEQAHTFIALFTDGDASMVPPQGFVKEIENFVKSKSLDCTIHTFGYGYSMDSGVLFDIAHFGGGVYAYIPDASMVGTALVNVMGSAMATFANKTIITVKTPGDVIDVVGHYRFQKRGENLIDIYAGPLQFGQPRNVCVTFETKNIENKQTAVAAVSVVCDAGSHKNLNDSPITQTNSAIGFQNSTFEQKVQLKRLEYVDALSDCMRKIGASTQESSRRSQQIPDSKIKQGVAVIKQILNQMNELKKANKTKSELLEGMICDIESQDVNEGQVTKALSTADWYLKWGMHYLSSLRCAHLLQQCHNFKDPGVQHYGGQVFKNFQQIAQDAFVSLPPPKPTAIVISSKTSAPIAAPTNMASYYVASGGCFDGNGNVKLMNGQTKKISDLKKGDQISNKASVVCVVKTRVNEPSQYKVVKLNGVFLTPYHPVKTSKQEWKYPIELGKVENYNQQFVYNLVLDSVHSISINDVECITLGHGIEMPVAKHDYFGSQKVIEDLKSLEGFENGIVNINQNDWVRTANSDVVVGLSKASN